MRCVALLLSMACVSAASLAAQTPAFEVASIKRNQSGDTSTFLNILPDGRFRAFNATVRDLIRAGYGFNYQAFHIVGGPSWIDTEHFDVDAKPDGAAPPEQIALMVRAMLVERFMLNLQKET